MPATRSPKSARRPSKPARSRGQVVARGDRKYLVRAFIGRDRLTGKRRYAARTIDGTHSQAQRALDALLGEIATGAYRAPVRVSLGDYLTGQWLPEKTAAAGVGALSGSCLADYTRAVHKLVKLAGALPLDAIGKAEVASIKLRIIAQHGEHLNAASRTFDVFRMAMNRAWCLDLIADNPARAERRIPIGKPQTAALDTQQTAAFLKAAKEYRDGRFAALFHVLLLGGLRPSEARALRWDDFTGDAVHVRRAATKDGQGRTLIGPTKTRTERTVPLPSQAIAALTEHRSRQAATILRAGVRSAWERNGRLIFPSQTGGVLDVEWMRRHWHAILKSAGLPRVRLYDARHTYCSSLMHAGTDAVTVATLVGHKDPSMTLRKYTHASGSSVSAAVAQLGDRMAVAEARVRAS